MKLVVCERECIPAWIYPSVSSDYFDIGTGIDVPTLTENNISALGKALNEFATVSESHTWMNSGCDVGFSHDSPDEVLQISSELLDALNVVPVHQRWKVAENWAQIRFGKRPNQEELANHKELLKSLCEFAAIVAASDSSGDEPTELVVVLIEPCE